MIYCYCCGLQIDKAWHEAKVELLGGSQFVAVCQKCGGDKWKLRERKIHLFK